MDPEIKFNLKRLGLAALSMIVFFILWRTTHQFIVCVALVCFGLNAVFGRKLKYNIIYTVVFTALSTPRLWSDFPSVQSLKEMKFNDC